MSQEQNNNNDQKKTETVNEQELSTEELDEILDEIKEENFWNACFDQVKRMKFYQKKHGEIDKEKFEKKYLKDGKIIDDLNLFKTMSRNSIHYYSTALNYQRLTGQDITHYLIQYKLGQKNLRLIQTYEELTSKLKNETPTMEGYRKWKQEYLRRYWDKKNESKPKKNN